jgi:hypothetical protein
VERDVRAAIIDLDNAYRSLQLAEERELSRERQELTQEQYRLGGITLHDAAERHRPHGAGGAAGAGRAFGSSPRGSALEEKLGHRWRLSDVAAPLSIGRPVAVAMFFLAVVFLGVISFTRLPVDLLPDIAYPKLVIYTTDPETAPAEVERFVTEPIEQAVAACPASSTWRA